MVDKQPLWKKYPVTGKWTKTINIHGKWISGGSI